MAKLNLKVGSKLDVTAVVGGEEIELKSSYAGESGGRSRISAPMTGGKRVKLEVGARVVLTWTADSGKYAVNGTVQAEVKQGVRTYLALDLADEVERTERRAYKRVEADLEVELITYTTDMDGKRNQVSLAGRTTDLSGGGAALVTGTALAVGETITMVLARRGAKKISLKADVCWCRPAPRGAAYRNAVGIQFVRLTPDEGAELTQLIAGLAHP